MFFFDVFFRCFFSMFFSPQRPLQGNDRQVTLIKRKIRSLLESRQPRSRGAGYSVLLRGLTYQIRD
ncbi:MAG TPA: hypothetical protein DD001_16485 [Microcoleaceae bacterium UBA10368]|nr:hypothetical protein [Microcoleaceae cyanobacterium UBA10368]HCV30710.1 hypothetical protein [Microcoleaceae cyanobacterium UBA9251]